MAIAWWQWRSVQDRLTTFGQALVSPFGRRYRIRLCGGGRSYNNPDGRLIQINCTMFPDEAAAVQFTATQGLLAHEAGHVLFTDGWPHAHENVLCQLVNMLEDERVERAVVRAYPGVRAALDVLTRLALNKYLADAKPGPAAQVALCLCLGWRWAKRRRLSQRRLLTAMKAGPAATALWRAVREHVEAAWVAPDTAGVIAEARLILDLLGLPPESPQCPLPFALSADLPGARGEPALPPPDETNTLRQPPEVTPPDETAPSGDDYLQPEPYLDLEADAHPLALQLAEALRLPEPDGHLQPHAYRGRYTWRQALRTPDTPCLTREMPARAARSSAFYVLADRSGSMDDAAPAVRLALMMLLLAGEQLATPVGCAVFGADTYSETDQRVLVLAPLSPRVSEAAKALVAGYTGETNCEFLDAGLAVAEKALMARPETHRFLVVIHDGQPVFPGDREASAAHLQRLTDGGLTPIGLYLGEDADDIAELEKLFPHLIVCAAAELPERLGDLLRALIG